MQEIKNLSIRYINKHYLFNLNKEQREIFIKKLKEGSRRGSLFVTKTLDSSIPEEVGTALILVEELFTKLSNKNLLRIANLLRHKDEWLRERASAVLIKFATKMVLPMIAKRLNDKNGIVRSNLCEALGRIKDDVSVKLLLKYLKDKDGLVRACAIEALEKLRVKEAIPLLEMKLADSDPLVRDSAVMALETLTA